MNHANHAIVVDASVAFKVVIQEEFTDRARALFAATLSAGRSLLGPPHLASEVTNAIYQRLRRRNITTDEANQALREFLQLPIQLIAPPELYEKAFLFARTNGLTSTYDSLYVVLAQTVEAELWTADRTLVNSVGAVAPWVRWIGTTSFSFPRTDQSGGPS